MPFLHFRFLFLHFCPGSREATFTQNPWNPWVLSGPGRGSGSVMVSGFSKGSERKPRKRSPRVQWMYWMETPICWSHDPIWGRGIAALAVPESAHRCTGWRHRSVGRTTRSRDGASQCWLSPRAHTVYWIETAICSWHSPNRGQGLLALPVPYRNQSGNPS